MAAESKLDAARRKGDLTAAIGALREEARTEMANAGTPARDQVGLEDAAIRVAAGLTGKSDVERRAAIREVRPGATVTSNGIAKTLLWRAEKIDRVKAWASALTGEQRTEYMIGEKYGALSENAQDVIAEAFGQIDEQEANATDLGTYDFDSETPDVAAIVGDDEDDEAEADDLGDSDYEALFEQAAWQSEQA